MLTLGIIVALRDHFTPIANNVRQSYQNLMDSMFGYIDSAGNRIDGIASRVGHSMYAIWTGTAIAMQGVAALAPLAFPIEKAAKYQHQLSMIKTVLTPDDIPDGKTYEQVIEGLDKSITSISRKTGTSVLEMARGAYNIVQANVKAEDEINMLLERAAMIKQSDQDATLEEATRGLVSIKNAFALTADSVEKTSNDLWASIAAGQMTFSQFNMSLGKTIGMVKAAAGDRDGLTTLREFYDQIATWTLSGGTASEGMTGYAQALKSMTKKREKAHYEMINDMRANGELTPDFVWSSDYASTLPGGMQEFFTKIYDAAKAYAKRTGLGFNDTLSKMIGGNKQGLAFVLNTANETMRQQYAKIHGRNNDRALDMAYEEAMNSIIRKWEKLKNSFERLGKTIGMPLMAPVGWLLDKFTALIDAVDVLTEKFPILTVVITEVSIALSSLLLAVGGLLIISGVMKIIQDVRAFHIWTRMCTFMGVAVNFVTGRLLTMVPMFLAIALVSYIVYKAWTENWGGIHDTIVWVWEKIKSVCQAMTMLMRTTSNGIGRMSKDMYNTLKENGMLEFVITLYQLYVRWLQFWEGLKEGFVAGFSVALALIKPVVLWILDRIAGLIDLWNRFATMMGLWRLDPESYTGIKLLGMVFGALLGFILPFFAIFKGLGSAIMFFVNLSLPTLNLLAGVIVKVWDGAMLLWRGFKAIILAVRTFGLLSSSMLGLPLLLIIAFAAFVYAVYTYWDEIQAAFQTGIDWVKSAIEKLREFLSNPIQAIVNWATTGAPPPEGSLAGGDYTVDQFGRRIYIPKQPVVGLSTGGDVNGSGLAFLHPDEVVINSETLGDLKSYLANPSDYMDSLANRAVTKDDDKAVMSMLAEQLQMVAQAMQQLGNRPIQATLPVILNGKEIARAVYGDVDESMARSY